MGFSRAWVELRSSATLSTVRRDLLDLCAAPFCQAVSCRAGCKGHSQRGIPAGWEHLSSASSRFWKREQTPRVPVSRCAVEGLGNAN